MFAVTSVVLVVSHPGPASHMEEIAKYCEAEGYSVTVCAAEPALSRLRSSGRSIIPFDAERFVSDSEERKRILSLCSVAGVVITDIGNRVASVIQEDLKRKFPGVHRAAYYDNPSPLVPGEYSLEVAKTARFAQTIFFSNTRLATPRIPLKKTEGAIIPETFSRLPLGINLLVSRGEALREKRREKKERARAEFFQKEGIPDTGQKIVMYCGGNNEEYLSKALPAFLSFIETALPEDILVVYQQHPRAKEHNRDLAAIRESSRCIRIGSLPSEETAVFADAVFYFQTTMAPEFVLGGIPVLQIAHAVYPDILIESGVVSSVTKGPDLEEVVKTLFDRHYSSEECQKVVEASGGSDPETTRKVLMEFLEGLPKPSSR